MSNWGKVFILSKNKNNFNDFPPYFLCFSTIKNPKRAVGTPIFIYVAKWSKLSKYVQLGKCQIGGRLSFSAK